MAKKSNAYSMLLKGQGTLFIKVLPRIVLILFCLQSACSLTASRPVQKMSNTAAALQAAKEAQADVLTPELYREAKEWFFKAKNAYELKEFEEAKEYARKARQFAEQAELQALLNGAERSSEAPADPLSSQ